jgi:hypothetical protein
VRAHSVVILPRALISSTNAHLGASKGKKGGTDTGSNTVKLPFYRAPPTAPHAHAGTPCASLVASLDYGRRSQPIDKLLRPAPPSSAANQHKASARRGPLHPGRPSCLSLKPLNRQRPDPCAPLLQSLRSSAGVPTANDLALARNHTLKWSLGPQERI